MATTKPVLYSFYRSGASWRVRIALGLKNVDYEIRPVDLAKDGGQQHSEQYKKLNPLEQVPTFVTTDGTSLTQSMAIIEYLEETRQGLNLLPKDPCHRAQARGLAEMVNSGIQPLQNRTVLQKVGEDKRVEWGKYWIQRGLHAIEKRLQDTAGKFCVGDQLTIADICLIPQVHTAANRFDVDMNQFPTISRIVEECKKLEAFRAADPLNQPDCPDNMKKQS